MKCSFIHLKDEVEIETETDEETDSDSSMLARATLSEQIEHAVVGLHKTMNKQITCSILF